MISPTTFLVGVTLTISGTGVAFMFLEWRQQRRQRRRTDRQGPGR